MFVHIRQRRVHDYYEFYILRNSKCQFATEERVPFDLSQHVPAYPYMYEWHFAGLGNFWRAGTFNSAQTTEQHVAGG